MSGETFYYRHAALTPAAEKTVINRRECLICSESLLPGREINYIFICYGLYTNGEQHKVITTLKFCDKSNKKSKMYGFY